MTMATKKLHFETLQLHVGRWGINPIEFFSYECFR